MYVIEKYGAFCLLYRACIRNEFPICDVGSVLQVLGRWKVNQPTLAILCKEAQRLIENFSEFSVQHVVRVCSLLSQFLALLNL